MPLVRTALAWRRYYDDERALLGDAGLDALLDRAPAIALPDDGALVFPHTRLVESGHLVAAVADAVVRSRREVVLALGVLHGAREVDAPSVAAARAGDTRAIAALRRVHGPGAPGDDGRWVEEFSLDGFTSLLACAAHRAGRPAPRVVARFPFLTGAIAEDLPGWGELARLRDSGAAIVATADAIHHGVGYATTDEQGRHRDAADAATEAWARRVIGAQLEHLARHEPAPFLALATSVRSDFRDSGPALAALLDGPRAATVEALTLVDYATALESEAPTWVAAALAAIR